MCQNVTVLIVTTGTYASCVAFGTQLWLPFCIKVTLVLAGMGGEHTAPDSVWQL